MRPFAVSWLPIAPTSTSRTQQVNPLHRFAISGSAITIRTHSAIRPDPTHNNLYFHSCGAQVLRSGCLFVNRRNRERVYVVVVIVVAPTSKRLNVTATYRVSVSARLVYCVVVCLVCARLLAATFYARSATVSPSVRHTYIHG